MYQTKISIKKWNQYIFLQLPVDENNIFTADITEKNEVENIKFKTSLEYVVTGLPINQNIDLALVALTDIDKQNFLIPYKNL